MTDLANAFRDKLFPLSKNGPHARLCSTWVWPTLIECKPEENGTTKTGATINTFTFDNLAMNRSILELHFYDIKGNYRTDFPTLLPAIVNFTSSQTVVAYTLPRNRGAKVVTLEYDKTVQIYASRLVRVALGRLPIPLPRTQLLWKLRQLQLGRGSSNFDGSCDPKSFNLVDPPMRNTVVLRKAGWVAIQFIANNLGEFIIHMT